MSPEMLLSKNQIIDLKAVDIWALGITFLNLVPFDDSNLIFPNMTPAEVIFGLFGYPKGKCAEYY